MSRQKSWTTEEIRIMRNSANLGLESVAMILDRSPESVKQAAKRYRISLRKPGSQGGLLLGQPRGRAWMKQLGMDPARLAAIRQEAIEGEIDLAELEERIREQMQNSAAICPRCVQRSIERTSTGLCEPCHIALLAQAHRDEAFRRQARRDLDAARQEKSRSTK